MPPTALGISRTALVRIERSVIVALTAIAAEVAWLWMANSGSGLFVAPHHHQGSADSFIYTLMMWQAMTIVMMMPTVLPWMLALAAVTPNAALRRVGAFTAAYFVVWLAYSGVMSAAQLVLQGSGRLPDGKLGGMVAGAVLIASGIFQFLPFKNACLSHCRNPLTYFMSRWRNGPCGGFRLGLVHGAYCLGCCWLLMMTGFAMGVMNMVWMAVLTVMIALEQTAPRGNRLIPFFGTGLTAWGCLLVVQAFL